MKTLVTAPGYFDEGALAIFRELGEVDVKKVTYDELLACIGEYDILAIRVDAHIDEKILNAAPKLKFIASATTGNNHIAMDVAKEKGIEVAVLQGINTIPTAEHVLGLMLALVRKIPAAQKSLCAGKWDRDTFIGRDLHGKKLGIVGFGRIGRHVGQLARGFGMEILAFDPYLPDATFAQHKATKMELDDLLRESDIVTLHTFLSDETRGMFNASKFSLMKPTAFFLNCCRGEVIVEEDLLSALQNKVIAGAALDVFVGEPIMDATNPLFVYAQSHDNLVVTPHIAGSSKESASAAGQFVAVKAKEFFNSQ